MPSPRRVLDPDLKLVEPFRIATKYLCEPELLELLLETRRESRIHAASAREDNCLEQRGTHVDISRLDGIEQKFRNARLFDINKMWLEEALRRLETLAANTDDSTIRQGIAFYQDSGFLAKALVKLEVIGDIAELFFDLADSFEIGGTVEGVASAKEERDEVSGHIATCNVKAAREMVKHDGFVDRDDVSYSVSRVDDNAGAET